MNTSTSKVVPIAEVHTEAETRAIQQEIAACKKISEGFSDLARAKERLVRSWQNSTHVDNGDRSS